MKKKLFLSGLLCASLIFGSLITGCGSSDDSGEETYTPSSQSVTEVTITFNANDGSDSPATKTQKASAGYITLDANTFTRSGYTFKGWAKTSDADSATYSDKYDSFYAHSDITLYAVWENNSYTITFDGNGGSTSSGETTATQSVSGDGSSASVTLDSNPFTKSGYIFIGWSSSSTSTTVSYNDEASISLYGSKTLYAVWLSEADALTVTLDSNDGTGNTKEIHVANMQNVSFSSYANIFTSDNATLKGFNTNADGTGTTYSVSSSSFSSSSLLVTENITLYAVWLENPKITFDGNGGTTSDGSEKTYQYQEGEYEYDILSWTFVPKNVDSTSTSETIQLDANPFTRDGYVFKGWTTSSASSTAVYKDKENATLFEKTTFLGVSVWSGTTLYAVWEKIPTTPTITYDMNGGSDDESFSETSSTITEKVPSQKYEYYDFHFWATSANATEATYVAGDEYPYTYDTILYAVWKLGTILSNKSVSVAKNSTSAFASFTLLKSETIKIAITTSDNLYYTINNGTKNVYESDVIGSNTTLTRTLSAGTYTISAQNKNIAFTNTATVTISGK